MADSECPGPCNNLHRKAQDAYKAALAAYDPLDAAESRPEPSRIRPILGDPWCQRCKSIIRAQLGELDDLTPIRLLFADGHAADTAPDPGRSGSSEPESPSPGGDDAEETWRMLASWEDAYRDLHGWSSPPRRGMLASRRTSTIAWLSDHLDGILISAIAEDFGAEVMQWHRELKARSKAGKRVLHKPLRCPGCKYLTLTWDEGEKYVQCGYCGQLLTYDEYEADVERIADGIGRNDIPDDAHPQVAVLLAG